MPARYCPLLPGCLFKSALNQAAVAFLDTLSGYTVADLVENRAHLLQLIEVAWRMWYGVYWLCKRPCPHPAKSLAGGAVVSGALVNMAGGMLVTSSGNGRIAGHVWCYSQCTFRCPKSHAKRFNE